MAKAITTDTIIIGIAVLWSLLLPYFPDTLFAILDSLIGVFVLLMLVLLALPQGAVAGVVSVIAVALTFVERNRRKINQKIIMVDSPDIKQQLAPAPPMSDNEVHPAFEYNTDTEAIPFYPENDNGTNEFEPVASSIDEKVAIPTISSNTDTAERFFIKNSFAKTDLA